MQWLWDNAVTLANVIMALSAVAALIYAHLSISEARKTELRGNARSCGEKR